VRLSILRLSSSEKPLSNLPAETKASFSILTRYALELPVLIRPSDIVNVYRWRQGTLTQYGLRSPEGYLLSARLLTIPSRPSWHARRQMVEPSPSMCLLNFMCPSIPDSSA
jgi:hypothetical protein